MTPLLDACYIHPSFLVIQQLIELGADVSLRNKVSHLISQSFSIQIFVEQTKCIAYGCAEPFQSRRIHY